MRIIRETICAIVCTATLAGAACAQNNRPAAPPTGGGLGGMGGATLGGGLGTAGIASIIGTLVVVGAVVGIGGSSSGTN